MTRKRIFALAMSIAAVAIAAALAYAWSRPTYDLLANGPRPAVGLYWYDNANPTVPPGMTAPLDQLLVRTDTPSLYYKSGASSEAWTLIGAAGGGGTVSSIACGTGLSCSPSSPITTVGTINVSLATTTCPIGQAEITTAADGTSTCAAFTPAASVAGTINTLAMFTSVSAVGDSPVVYDGSNTVTVTNKDLAVDTNGQSELFSTFVGSASDGLNIWIGGGGQNDIGSGANPYFGSRNVSLGNQALNDNSSGYDNVAIGVQALQHNIGNNVGLGANQGHDNVAIGNGAMISNLIGETCIAIGGNALAANTLSRNLIAIGFQALQADTAQDNIAIGNDSMLLNTSGTENVSIGTLALSSNLIGTDDIAIGHSALTGATGNDNIAIGVNAEGAGTGPSSIQNIGIGTSALLGIVGGYQNLGLGTAAGYQVSNGFANTFVGDQTGAGITTGSTNTILGANVHGLASGTTSKIILADGTGTATDQVWLSPAAPTSVSFGSLGTGSSDTVGNVTGIGAHTSVVLTYSATGFPNRSWCHAETNSVSVTVETIVVTNSATAPTFSCYSVTTVPVLTNCDDFTYWCTGQ